MRLHPYYPDWILANLGKAYKLLGREDEAVATHRKLVERAPDLWWAHGWLATTYGWFGRYEEARPELAEVLRLNPEYSQESHRVWVSQYQDPKIRERFVDIYRKIGLPEKSRTASGVGAEP
jgi:tetratricopeptide (TPR) repeat protein